MVEDRVCVRCGESISSDEADCPYCAGRKTYPFLHREPVLIAAIVALAVALWLVTHGVSQAYAHREDHLARTWYAAGDAALRNGSVDESISDLRTALAYSHSDPKVRLRLAEALAAAGQIRQAHAYLLALWEESPADGNFNLELARLAARTGEMAEAQRYYHGAIYGLWNDDPIARRRNVRLELVRFLLSRRATQQAESELIALAADLPPDPQWQMEVGQLLLQVADPGRALALFRAVIAKGPRDAGALAAAGEAAFQLQDYVSARHYLQRALALNPSDVRSAQLLQTAELVLQLDPYEARIGREERARRVLRAFEQTQYRLEKCAEQKGIPIASNPPGVPIAADYQEFEALSPHVGSRALRDDPDLVDTAMQLVFRSQNDAASACGQPAGEDLALLLLGHVNGARR